MLIASPYPRIKAANLFYIDCRFLELCAQRWRAGLLTVLSVTEIVVVGKDQHTDIAAARSQRER